MVRRVVCFFVSFLVCLCIFPDVFAELLWNWKWFHLLQYMSKTLKFLKWICPDITTMVDWAQRKQTPSCFPSIVLRKFMASWKKGQFAVIFGTYIVFPVPDSSCPCCLCWCSCACTSCAWSTNCSPLPSCCVRLWTSSWRRILMAFLRNLCHSKRLVCV